MIESTIEAYEMGRRDAGADRAREVLAARAAERRRITRAVKALPMFAMSVDATPRFVTKAAVLAALAPKRKGSGRR